MMSRRLISTGSPFEKTAGYSRAVIDGDFAFVAGTTGYDYATMTMPDDVASQARNCFKTIEAALKEGGFAMADIVRATYYITDVENADAVLAVCGETLGDIRPAATILVVSGVSGSRSTTTSASGRKRGSESCASASVRARWAMPTNRTPNGASRKASALPIEPYPSTSTTCPSRSSIGWSDD